MSAIVCFGIPERTVDVLIEVIAATQAAPDRWIVFGTDANLLGALDQQWSNVIDLVLALLPTTDAAMRDVALEILALEAISRASSLWVQGSAAACTPPDGFRAVLVDEGRGSGCLVESMRQFSR
jgi:hypothetical protein